MLKRFTQIQEHLIDASEHPDLDSLVNCTAFLKNKTTEYRDMLHKIDIVTKSMQKPCDPSTLHSRLRYTYYICQRTQKQESSDGMLLQIEWQVHRPGLWNSNEQVFCPRICVDSIHVRQTDTNLVQIDESYFAGRRKYSRGRVAAGGKKGKREDDDDDELEDWRANHHDGAVSTTIERIG